MVEKLEIGKIKKHVDSVSLAYDLLSSRNWTPETLFNFLYVKNDYSTKEREQINNILNPKFTPVLGDYYNVGRYVKQMFEQNNYPPIQGYVASTDIIIDKNYMSRKNCFKIQTKIGSVVYEMEVELRILTDSDYFDRYGYFVIKPALHIKENSQNLVYEIKIYDIVNQSKWKQDNEIKTSQEVFDKYDQLRVHHSYFDLLGKWKWSNAMLQGSKEYSRTVYSLAKKIKFPFNTRIVAMLTINPLSFIFKNSMMSRLYEKGQNILIEHENDYKDCKYSWNGLSKSDYVQKSADLPPQFKEKILNSEEYIKGINDILSKFDNVFKSILKNDNITLTLASTSFK